MIKYVVIDKIMNIKEIPKQQDEIDRQRLVTNYIISDFLLYLMKILRSSCKIESSYLIQLITDANGVLVFFKFLTEKFNESVRKMDNILTNDECSFVDVFERAIKTVLKIMFICCNNYPDKIKKYLIKYQAYLTIKKFPNVFGKNEKIKKYSYYLLKLQINQFTKSQRNSGNNMKMITEIYCKQLPKPKQEVNEDKFTKEKLKSMYLFEKQKEKLMPEMFIDSQEDLRKIHIDYNNYYYWKNPNLEKKTLYYNQNDYLNKLMNPTISEEEKKNYEEWLEENVWNYFD